MGARDVIRAHYGSWERGGIRFQHVISSALRNRERNSTFLPEWSAYTMADPSDWDRDRIHR